MNHALDGDESVADSAAPPSGADPGRAEAAPSPWLTGCPQIRVGVSQIFRIADLLTEPNSEKARAFHEALTDRAKLNRLLSGRGAFRLGRLGTLKPIITIPKKTRYAGERPKDRDAFWSPALSGRDLSLGFIPLELSLDTQLREFMCQPESVLEQALQGPSAGIRNVQVGGRLRIYPPGVGVIRLQLSLEFREAVHIEVVAQIARYIEDLLFVRRTDGEADQRPLGTLLEDIVGEVVRQLGLPSDIPGRRYSPPEISFGLSAAGGLQPEERIGELARLMNLAQAQPEPALEIERRIRAALNSPHWRNYHVLAVAGQGVELFFVADTFAQGRKARQKTELEWLEETHELVSAAVRAQEEFALKIEEFYGPLALDATYRPGGGEGFERLSCVLTAMRDVMRAVASIKLHLHRLQDGALMAHAKAVWARNDRADHERLQQGLAYIGDWLSSARAATPAGAKPEQQLRDQIVAHFTLDELRTLCADAGFNYDDLREGGIVVKTLDLLEKAEHEGRLQDLLSVARRMRPQLSWEFGVTALPASPLAELGQAVGVIAGICRDMRAFGVNA